MKHTPGPWVLQQLETNHSGYDWPTFAVRSTPGNYCLAVVGDVDRATADVNKGNACLIAAAPDLWAASKEVLRISDRKHDAWDKLKAAIAIAEGGAA
jgi:hypothetical protein